MFSVLCVVNQKIIFYKILDQPELFFSLNFSLNHNLCSVAGIRTLRSCGPNLLFDRSLGDCNMATAVKCERDPVISSTSLFKN